MTPLFQFCHFPGAEEQAGRLGARGGPGQGGLRGVRAGARPGPRRSADGGHRAAAPPRRLRGSGTRGLRPLRPGEVGGSPGRAPSPAAHAPSGPGRGGRGLRRGQRWVGVPSPPAPGALEPHARLRLVGGEGPPELAARPRPRPQRRGEWVCGTASRLRPLGPALDSALAPRCAGAFRVRRRPAPTVPTVPARRAGDRNGPAGFECRDRAL